MEDNTYTIISAVYNSEKYLDKFFSSIFRQSLDSEKYIDLIMVDDGSVDGSEIIIKKWQQRYTNIKYLYQKNSGQATARNNGLSYVKTPWVTFIDSDDFISKDYFKHIHNFLKQNDTLDISIVACKLVYYFEKWHTYIDYHPLRYNFKNTEDIVKISSLEKKIQLSASSALFQTKLINDIGLRFDKKIQPNFEDAYFIGQYLLEYSESYMLFFAKSKYFYRKRKNNTSTVDTSWKNSAKYNQLLKFGYLNLFKIYQNRVNEVPLHIQRMVLYDLIWHHRVHLDTPKITEFLSVEQKQTYNELLYLLFIHIDTKTILDFELAGCEFYHKMGLLNLYKNSSMPYQIIYIDKINHNKVYAHYFAPSSSICSVMIDRLLVPVKIIEKRELKFLDKVFVIQYSIEFYLEKNSQNIEIAIDAMPVYINQYNRGEKLFYTTQHIKTNKLKSIKSFLKKIARKILLNEY